MFTPKVVILYSQSLFAAGVEVRLRQVGGLQVIRVDAAENDLVARIAGIAPDVIIVDELDKGLKAHVSVLEILSQAGATRVIGLDSNSSDINIYYREGRPALSGADLASVISDQLAGSQDKRRRMGKESE